MVLSLEEDSVGVVIFGDDSTIKEDDVVSRTNEGTSGLLHTLHSLEFNSTNDNNLKELTTIASGLFTKQLGKTRLTYTSSNSTFKMI